jgi:predicted metalloprotease with PDZ domain
MSTLLVPILWCVAGAPASVTYQIAVEPRLDRTDIVVEARWSLQDRGPETVLLPQDNYGSGDLTRFVTELVALGDTTIAREDAELHKARVSADDGGGEVRYRLSFDAEFSRDASFGPISKPTHFQAFFCQWMLRFGEGDEARRYDIEFSRVPDGWNVYSTAGKGRRFTVEGPMSELRSAVLGAGLLETHSFSVMGRNVDVFFEDEIQLDGKAVLANIESVVSLQREWFGHFDWPNYTITLSARPGIRAGTCVENGFVCFVRPDVSHDALLLLLSHEMFHNWLPLRIRVEDPGAKDRWMWEWFDEGFAEYFARLVLLDAGLMDRAAFVEHFNEDLRNIADSPVRAVTYAEVKVDIAEGKFTSHHKRLSYYRGALMALDWDHRIRESSNGEQSLAKVIHDLHALATLADGKLTIAQFDKAFGPFGIAAGEHRLSYVRDGNPIVPDPESLGPDHRLLHVDLPTLDFGFDSGASDAAGHIVGLAPGGPADRAGIRDGMQLVSRESSGRLYDGTLRVTVVVVKDGVKSSISYPPLGQSKKVWQFRKTHK